MISGLVLDKYETLLLSSLRNPSFQAFTLLETRRFALASPLANASSRAAAPAMRTWSVFSKTILAALIGFLMSLSNATPAPRSVFPSMIAASVSISPLRLSVEPLPALNTGSSSSDTIVLWPRPRRGQSLHWTVFGSRGQQPSVLHSTLACEAQRASRLLLHEL